MPFRMDLVAGRRADILTALALDTPEAFLDRTRFDHLPLGGAIDPTWLDRFSEAVRGVTGGDAPEDFLDARTELDGPGEAGGRIVESVDGRWIGAIARLEDHRIDAVAGAWIELLEEDLGELPREEKPWIRGLAADIVGFCRRADARPDVLLAWSL
jgi:hypothetical protein